jgi:hypothetical protein
MISANVVNASPKAKMKSQKQLDMELEKQDQEAALDREAQKQTENPPLLKNQWLDHTNNCLGPVVKYILRGFIVGGVHVYSTEFFVGTRVFDPIYAASITVQEAHGLLEKLRTAFDNDANIKVLKASFPRFKCIASSMNLISVEDILQWYLNKTDAGMDAIILENTNEIGTRISRCGGIMHFNCFGAAFIGSSRACIFSFKICWNEQQTSALGDIIIFYMLLNYNIK